MMKDDSTIQPKVDTAKIKVLRERTGAGLLDCKTKLAEAEGNIEAAIELLRIKGLTSAAKKFDREAKEGAVGVIIQDGKHGAIIEINAETDFVVRNENFQILANKILAIATNHQNLETLKQAQLPTSNTVEEEINKYIAIFGENIVLHKFVPLSVNQGIVAANMYQFISKEAKHIGKSGVLVALETEATGSELELLAKNIALQVNSCLGDIKAVTVEDLDPNFVAKERTIILEQTKHEHPTKPEALIEKIVEGKLRNLYKEIVLLEQTFVRDQAEGVKNPRQIKGLINEFEQQSGHKIQSVKFVRERVGK